MGQEELIATIIAGTVVLFLLSTGVVFFIIFFNKAKRRTEREAQEREVLYFLELAEVKGEVQAQTLTNIARELHDDFGQLLTLVKMRVEGLNGKTLENDRSELSTLTERLINDIRSYSRSLNGDRLKQKGLVNSILDELSRIDRAGYLNATIRLEKTISLGSPDKEVIVYRIFQEFLNNSLKHSEADNFFIGSTSEEGHIVISMSDDGCGFDLTKTEGDSSGLLNIRSRAELIGADCRLSAMEGEGTSLELRIPIL